ncbi:delta-sarcoglycan [Folsomia candida]|nr:delta-sarcoglycan [Folsomia candida]XP_035708986.1 delta-sarcoglycan [Folsomia candida]XP_035708987.1 delta-sarcoglycan [Folsomia candida]XP_035708988.1 delta-sarcoglycan [Folsomia candida]
MVNRREAEMENEWLSADETKKNFVAKYHDGCQVGLFGWRRRCLFLVLIILLLLVIINLALTLWILKVMEFSTDGMGPLKVVPGGIQLRGESMVLDSLIASKIRSRRNQPIHIESSKNISLIARGPDGRVLNKLFLGDDKLECQASGMKITDTRGRLLFSADRKEVLVGAELLRVTGEGGAVFHGSVQTPLVRAESGNELRLESPTRNLEVFATHGIGIDSLAGDISATCLADLKLQSTEGSVRMDAPNIYMPKLQTATLTSAKLPTAGTPVYNPSTIKRTGSPEVYQVCVCGKGRLFLAPPDGPCVADNDVCR